MIMCSNREHRSTANQAPTTAIDSSAGPTAHNSELSRICVIDSDRRCGLICFWNTKEPFGMASSRWNHKTGEKVRVTDTHTHVTACRLA